jgi:cell division septum initiation protein DivIVA
MDASRMKEIHDAMAQRAEAAALDGESRDEVQGWLTVIIQDLVELKARVEELESAP